MRLIREHKMITCILAVILALIVFFGISLSSGGGSGIFGKATNAPVTAGEDAAEGGVSVVKDFFVGIMNYKDIMAENEALKAEVSKLEQQLLEAKVTENQLKELKKLSKALDYRAVEKGDPVAADVVAYDGTTWLNSFTINRGTKAGIKKDDVVVCGKGLVGKVSEVGGNWAKVKCVVDSYSKTSFTVLRDSEILGMTQGDGEGKLAGYVLDAEASIIEGDVLLTSGMGMYPAGIEMGTVTEVQYNADTQIKNIKVDPSVDFKSITKVVVIS